MQHRLPAILLGCFLVAGSCRDADHRRESTETLLLSPLSSQMPLDADSEDQLATVNGIPLMIDQVRHLLETDTDLDLPEAVNRGLDQILMVQEAARRELHLDPQTIREYRKALALALLTRNALTVQPGIIAEEVVNERFLQQKRRFELGPRRHVIHAVVRTGSNAHSETDAERISRELFRELSGVSTEAPFRQIADKFKQQHGHIRIEKLPPFDAESTSLVGAFVDAAFSISYPAKPLSAPVQTSFGWHVLLVLEELSARQTSKEEAFSILREEIAREEREVTVRRMLDEVMSSRRIFYHDAPLATSEAPE